MRGLRLLLVMGIVHAFFTTAAEARPVDPSVLPQRIAFGSCNFQRRNQDHWQTISALQPDLWVWLGDIIYADYVPMWVREGEYNLLFNQPGYAQLREYTMIAGTWDDHDYAYNNQGRGFENKAESQQLVLNFLEEPASSPRRYQEGIYASYTFGPEGRRLRLILLDERYHREHSGPDSDMLGEGQWAWLENEFANTPADVELTLIGSSTQVLNRDGIGETWFHFGRERERLLGLINLYTTPLHRIVILSGDRHFAEIARAPLAQGAPLYEITASGLTHSSPTRGAESNRFRISDVVDTKNFGVLELDWSQMPVGVTTQLWTTTGELRVHYPLEF